jgi:hypothetical protein
MSGKQYDQTHEQLFAVEVVVFERIHSVIRSELRTLFARSETWFVTEASPA